MLKTDDLRVILGNPYASIVGVCNKVCNSVIADLEIKSVDLLTRLTREQRVFVKCFRCDTSKGCHYFSDGECLLNIWLHIKPSLAVSLDSYVG